MQQTPYDQTYLQSYLVKAGIRFDFNLVDTICHRGFNFNFYLAVIAALLIFGFPLNMLNAAAEGEGLSSGSLIFYTILLIALVAYILCYWIRWTYFSALRMKLRQDDAPLSVEAYAVVCLDVKRNWGDYFAAWVGRLSGKGENYFCKYAVIYKEVGTKKPRFYLSAATSAKKINFIPEHVGLVFLHRNKPALYSLDDQSSYQTSSAKSNLWNRVLEGSANMSPQQSSTQQSDVPAESVVDSVESK